jgi:hypothetical protein
MNDMEQNENTTLTPDAMIAQLRAMRQQIPDYSQLTTRQSKSLATASSVSQEMVNAAANAIGESPLVQASVGTTVEEVRQTSADGNVWNAVEAELEATLRGVAKANLVRRHRLGTLALTTYAISRALVRKPEHANLIPHVDALRRTNRIGRHAVKPAGTPSQEPAPAPVPASPQRAVAADSVQ